MCRDTRLAQRRNHGRPVAIAVPPSGAGKLLASLEEGAPRFGVEPPYVVVERLDLAGHDATSLHGEERTAPERRGSS